ncbi:MAG: methyl-accepting chemotaxis protein [Ectothiorhodospiraceae bacterium]|nr:methyl-accepting chemotaxis protein [Ectothiorhodospiraceae bacterium]
MTRYLRQFRISFRIWFVLGVAAVVFTVAATVSLRSAHHNLTEERLGQATAAVEAGQAILAHFHSLEENGTITREVAQEQAVAAIGAIRYLGEEYLWVNDMDGVMLMHPFAPELHGRDVSGLEDETGSRFVQLMIDGARQHGSTRVRYYWPRPGGEEPLLKESEAQHFQPWDFMIASGVYMDDVRAAAWRSLQGQIVALGVGLIILITVGWSVVRSITGPLESTTEAIRNASREPIDLGYRLPVSGRDELDILSDSINSVFDTLEHVVNDVRGSSDQLLASSAHLTSLANSADQTMRSQEADTDDLASAMTEMAATVQEVARNASDAAAAANEASGQTGSGKETVMATGASIAALADQLEEVRNAMERLNGDTANVDKVLDVINGVAEQTNLLALNAAIEAARAGEQGRGFSVVAEEVRTLALRTRSSTDEIRDILERLQGGAADMTDALRQRSEEARQTSIQAKEAEQSLDAISQSVDAITDRNNQIASAAEEQAATAEQINGRVTGIRDAAQAGTRTLSEVRDAADALQDVAARLQQGVSRLKTRQGG